jgi:hypothetical protein
MKTEEDEAWEELEARLGRAQIEKAMVNLGNELEIYRNEILEEVATKLEQEFTLPFGTDTVASFAIWIRRMKREAGSKQL